MKIKSKKVCYGLVVNRKRSASNLPYCPYTDRLRAFPVPFFDQLVLAGPGLDQLENVQFHDINGRLLFIANSEEVGQITDNRLHLDLKSFPQFTGLVIVTIETAAGTQRKRLFADR